MKHTILIDPFVPIDSRNAEKSREEMEKNQNVVTDDFESWKVWKFETVQPGCSLQTKSIGYGDGGDLVTP